MQYKFKQDARKSFQVHVNELMFDMSLYKLCPLNSPFMYDLAVDL